MTVALFDAPRPLLEAIRSELGPDFVNPQQRAFFASRAPELLYSGAFGAGKSRIGCEKAFWLAQWYPGIPIGIFRKIAASIEKSTERTFVRDVVIPSGQRPHHNKTSRTYTFANGSQVMFFGLDPDSLTGLPRIGSVELGWAFIDEAVECDESDWVQVQGRLRWPGIDHHQIAAATNPASPAHWLKRRFTPPTSERVYLHAATIDNPALPADYVANQQAAYGEGYFRQRYLEGQWVAAEGQIWLLPDNQVGLLEPLNRAGLLRRVVAGIDWGYQHPFACEVIGETGAGRRGVLAEVYHRARTVASVIPELKQAMNDWGISAFYADPSEPAYIEECRQAGLPVHEARNDVLPGITAVTEEIAHGMLVSPECTGLLSEIPGYVWASDRNGVKDQPIKQGDDACDALRYAVMGLRGSTTGDWSMVA